MLKEIVVQAGGRGSRLEILTANKPKALVPVDNLPMIFHLFKKYPDAHFKIIADYKKDVLKRYLQAFATVSYEIIEADGKGTCAGISSCLSKIPENTPFMLIWCDLLLAESAPNFLLDETKNYIGISKSFPCRWSFVNNQIIEEPSETNGIAGLFIFKNKNELYDVPNEGEFVRYLAAKEINFNVLEMNGCMEIGTMLSYFQNELNKIKSRSFNRLEFTGGVRY